MPMRSATSSSRPRSPVPARRATERRAALRKSIGKSATLDPVRAAIAADLVGPLRDGSAAASPTVQATTTTSPSGSAPCTASGRPSTSTTSSTMCSGSRTGRARSPRPTAGTRLCWMVDPHGPACPDCRGQRAGRTRRGRRRVPHRAHAGTRPRRMPLPARPRVELASPPMRRPSDLPRRRAFGRFSGRVVLIVVAVLLFVLIVFGRALARFYVDYLWHDSLGRSDVFWGVLWAKVTLFVSFFAVFLVLAGLNLYIADRTAPKAFPANVHPYVERFHEVFGHRLRLVRYGTAGRARASSSPCRRRGTGRTGCCSATARRSASTTRSSAPTSASTCSSCRSSRS